MLGLKQPVLGIVTAILGIALSLGFISIFTFPMFASWASFLVMSVVPMQITVSVAWAKAHPKSAVRERQPVKGILLAGLTIGAGVLFGTIYIAITERGTQPPGPMATHAMIGAVISTFWQTIIFDGWPWKRIFSNPMTAGLATLFAAYVTSFVIYRVFLNYAFLDGAPFYVPANDPHGLFPAPLVVCFEVTAIAVMFFMLAFDLWPLSSFPGLMKQPLLGFVWSFLCLAIGGAAFWLGVMVRHIDAMVFMVRGPIPYIFGTIIVLNMLQNSIFGKLKQPLKGIVNSVTIALVGTGLAEGYRQVAPIVTGPLESGPPTYGVEIWLASALLGVTFPVLVFMAEFLDFWPFQRAPASSPSP